MPFRKKLPQGGFFCVRVPVAGFQVPGGQSCPFVIPNVN